MAISTFPSRGIAKRLHISGNLVLTAPAHFGGGVAELGPEMTLALDPLEKKPVIWGTSLAGALRAYLFSYLHGFIENESEYKAIAEDYEDIVNQLFGFQVGDEGAQSWLIVSDAIAEERVFEVRDMVDIDPATRSAVDEHKFDAELIASGISFPICIELLLPREETLATELVNALAIALRGLEDGEISLGAKKNRGWGACEVTNWNLQEYDCDSAQGLLEWLADGDQNSKASSDICTLLGIPEVKAKDQRETCVIETELFLDSPLLIGSSSGSMNDPNNEQLTYIQVEDGEITEQVLISGTAFAGVLRNQCTRILNTLGYSEDERNKTQNKLWGFVEKGETARDAKAFASRVYIQESILENVFHRVQARTRIDHFTGGSYRGALFEEGIVIPRGLEESPSKRKTNASLRMTVKNPTKRELGLLLLALGDLCTCNANVGSGYGIGRGLMSMKSMVFKWIRKGNTEASIHLERDLSDNGSQDCFNTEYKILVHDEEKALPLIHDWINAVTERGK